MHAFSPGEITPVHTHQWPASLYIISRSDFIRYDAEGNTLPDSEMLPKTPSASTAIWSEPLAPHALKNTGDKNLHVISVEVKKRRVKRFYTRFFCLMLSNIAA
jgi:quercetin dioxygenase-like cupin family protein